MLLRLLWFAYHLISHDRILIIKVPLDIVLRCIAEQSVLDEYEAILAYEEACFMESVEDANTPEYTNMLSATQAQASPSVQNTFAMQ